MPKPRFSDRLEQEVATAAPAVVLPFPLRKAETQTADVQAADGSNVLAPAPKAGERPARMPPVLREWLKAALIVSLAVHAVVFLAFQMRFEDDLERAAGAAASAASDGTVTIPIEIVAESMLPSAPLPTDASEADAAKPEPAQQAESPETQEETQTPKIDELIPPPPEPAPVVLPTREEAQRLALPEEETAPPVPAETASTPRAPATVEFDEKPPLPLARPPVPPKTVQERSREKPEKQKTARPAPSTAASPSQAASTGSAGNAGAGGSLDAGGRAMISSYQAQVLAHLSRHRVYPPEARSQGATGVARVRFALARDGRVISASLVGGSGEQILDRAAIDMVQRAAPFPPFPASLTQARMDFAAPIRFDLR